jgi:hypothetical protein
MMEILKVIVDKVPESCYFCDFGELYWDEKGATVIELGCALRAGLVGYSPHDQRRRDDCPLVEKGADDE